LVIPTVQLRPRNAAVTRAALLQAARARFADYGYDATSLRDVAADAGVDAALVARYFGSKDELFAAALEACDDNRWTDGGAEGLPERLSGLLFEDKPGAEDVEGLMILLRSTGSPRAREIAARWSEETFLKPLGDLLQGDDARARACLAGSLMLGVMVSRALFCNESDPAFQGAFRERLVAALEVCIKA
jgi:AcrR family transcriptional regulator